MNGLDLDAPRRFKCQRKKPTRLAQAFRIAAAAAFV